MAQSISHQVSSSGLGQSPAAGPYLTAVQFMSADMAPPAMPHSSCIWKQKSIVYSLGLQLVWLMWQYDATEIHHNQKKTIYKTKIIT